MGSFGENFTMVGLWLLDFRDCVDSDFKQDFLNSWGFSDAELWPSGFGCLFDLDVEGCLVPVGR